MARLIHQGSKRADGPFVVVNCSALPAERLEIELFGTDEEGQAMRCACRAPSRWRMAARCSLKEVADLPLPLQSRLARVLQEQSFTRGGGTTKVEVDVRVLASTGRVLQDEIASGAFREELYHRLNVVALRVPPLSERREDIRELANDLLRRVADATGLPSRTIGEDTLAALQGHDWPGNVRQLRNVIERLLILAPAGGAPIRADVLPNDVSEDAPSVLRWEKGGEIMQLPLRDAREVFEREYLLAQVTRFGGNISRTATFVGMERSALHRKLKSLGLHGGARRRAPRRRNRRRVIRGAVHGALCLRQRTLCRASRGQRPYRGSRLSARRRRLRGRGRARRQADRRDAASSTVSTARSASSGSPGRCRARRSASSSAS